MREEEISLGPGTVRFFSKNLKIENVPEVRNFSMKNQINEVEIYKFQKQNLKLKRRDEL